MATGKIDKTAIATFADHEVITPPNRLKDAVSHATGDDDPVARAEQALAQLSSEFSGWMDTECERLDLARDRIRKTGLTGNNRQELFRAAHDVKGEAATFGFPLVAAAADSLCRLIEHTPDPQRVPLALIDQHVDAVRAIMREHARPDAEAIAGRLTSRLREVTEDFLRRENKDLDDLDGLLSPPLVPDSTST